MEGRTEDKVRREEGMEGEGKEIEKEEELGEPKLINDLKAFLYEITVA